MIAQFRAYHKPTKMWLQNHTHAEMVARTAAGNDPEYHLMLYALTPTGSVLDQAGDNICEGDILKVRVYVRSTVSVHPDHWYWDEFTAVVKFTGCFFDVDGYYLQQVSQYSKRIGNIYDNPELLKEVRNG